MPRCEVAITDLFPKKQKHYQKKNKSQISNASLDDVSN